MAEHRWSGWPGAWCLDCGCEDQMENALADETIYFAESEEPEYKEYGKPTWASKELEEKYNASRECPEPGSDRFNPYVNKEKE